MKKRICSLLVLALCALLLFSGCGAGAKSGSDNIITDSSAYNGAAAPSAPPEADMEMAAPMEDAGESGTNDNVMDSAGGLSGLLEYPKAAENGEKLIYTAQAELETLDFEDSVEAVYTMLARFDAFLESSDISGTDYASRFYGYQNYRRANFTIRVPKENFSSMMDSLGEIGNVIYSSAQAENITTQFTDTQSRLNMYKTEEERLLAMLEQAVTVDEMIQIESRLSEVRYNIESLTTQLNNWQKQIDYSTVYLTLNEVEELKEEVPIQRSYWEQVGDSFRDGLRGLGSFFKDFLRILIAALPVLALCAALAGIVLGILFGVRRRRRKRRNAQAKPPEEAQSKTGE